MNWGKLGRKIKKDFARHRGKTVALVLLSFVAIFMWAPIVAGKGKKKAMVGRAKVIEQTTPVSVGMAAPRIPVLNHEMSFEWETFLTTLREDPQMASRHLSAELRDPFVAIEPVIVAPESHASSETPAAVEPQNVIVDITPEQAGLVLRGTLVGRRTQMANINGVNYSRGEEIVFGSSSENKEELDSPHFRLVDVTDTTATLERHGKTYRLELPATGATSSGNITIRAAVPGRNR